MEMRFMLDHTENQIGIQTEPRTVAANQFIDSAVTRSPAALFPTGLFRHARVALDALDAVALDEDRKGVSAVPRAGIRFGDVFRCHARAAFSGNPERFG